MARIAIKEIIVETTTVRKPYDASLENVEAQPVRENPTEGIVPAVLCDIVPLGFMMQDPPPGKSGKSREVFKLDVIFQIEEENSRGYRFTPRRRFNLSLNEKSSFRPVYEALVGRRVSPEEEQGKSKVGIKTLIALIGKNVQIGLAPSPDGKYMDITTVTPLGKGQAPVTVSDDYVRAKDRPAVGA